MKKKKITHKLRKRFAKKAAQKKHNRKHDPLISAKNCNELSGTLDAYTPYMVEMKSTTLGINSDDGVTLKSSKSNVSDKRLGDARSGDWVFRGSLQKKEWSKENNIITKGRLWAFTVSARNGATIGQFKRFGGENWVNPFRAYLVDCSGVPDGSDCEEFFETQPKASFISRYHFVNAFAPTNSAENSLFAETSAGAAASETASLNDMDIVIVDGDEDSFSSGNERPTVIGRFNPATGEIRMLPRTTQTYDLKGRRVKEGKKAKGAYYRK